MRSEINFLTCRYLMCQKVYYFRLFLWHTQKQFSVTISQLLQIQLSVFYPLSKITSRERLDTVSKRRPMDVPIWSSMHRQGTSPTNVMWTLKHDILRTFQCNILRTSHIFLYVTTRDVRYQRLEDASCRRYEDVRQRRPKHVFIRFYN